MILLAIETSCDETSIAVLERKREQFILRSHFLASQISTHAKYGGVVPEVAARMHVEVITPGLNAAIKQAKVSLKDIDAVAVTAGPGLITSLLISIEAARTLAWSLKKPLVAVNHLEGHLYANWLPNDKNHQSTIQKNPFPALGLIVSGGHTELVLMTKHGKYKKLGQTRDDAAGEAFDKVAKLMGLGYPGGPILSKLATKGDPESYNWPRPMLNSQNLDFSFAGLKTAVRYYLDTHKVTKKQLPDLAASFEQAVVDVLIHKTLRALKQHKVKTLLLAGGVAANTKLRHELGKAVSKRHPQVNYLQPNLKYCTDNAAMIAAAGYWHAKKKNFTPWQKLDADPNWELA
ncbi:tRNA (adenosine(37)-N6)-threonylcarbamoyltransferase complex transferase subunit TsaD [Patescibacteria group bacterium]|nr:tRNA (adenosine(37)-N6)-threonylcarbamoyltransferase complex transferase subunit TsaD [Patescibacteria group bacterium]